jgi:hypothetical protein
MHSWHTEIPTGVFFVLSQWLAVIVIQLIQGGSLADDVCISCRDVYQAHRQFFGSTAK